MFELFDRIGRTLARLCDLADSWMDQAEKRISVPPERSDARNDRKAVEGPPNASTGQPEARKQARKG